MITIRDYGVKSVRMGGDALAWGGVSLARLALVAVLSVAVYVALFGSVDLFGVGAAGAADAQDPFAYAAEKGKAAGTGFMTLVRLLMVVVIVGVCVYAAWKGGKVSPVWIIAILLAGVTAVKADVVVKWFGDSNPFEQLK